MSSPQLCTRGAQRTLEMNLRPVHASKKTVKKNNPIKNREVLLWLTVFLFSNDDQANSAHAIYFIRVGETIENSCTNCFLWFPSKRIFTFSNWSYKKCIQENYGVARLMASKIAEFTSFSALM